MPPCRGFFPPNAIGVNPQAWLREPVCRAPPPQVLESGAWRPGAGPAGGANGERAPDRRLPQESAGGAGQARSRGGARGGFRRRGARAGGARGGLRPRSGGARTRSRGSRGRGQVRGPSLRAAGGELGTGRRAHLPPPGPRLPRPHRKSEGGAEPAAAAAPPTRPRPALCPPPRSAGEPRGGQVSQVGVGEGKPGGSHPGAPIAPSLPHPSCRRRRSWELCARLPPSLPQVPPRPQEEAGRAGRRSRERLGTAWPGAGRF